MTKTKRTLIISSLIMTLALIVAIVSVSAAWFGDSVGSKQDGFIIDSDTLQEFASIKVDSDVTGEGGTKLWPAIAKKGWLLTNGNIAPTGSVLKSAEGVEGIDEGAKKAVIYFPVSFIGTADVDSNGNVIDGRKSLNLNVSSVTIEKYVTKDSNGEVTDFVDFRAEFNVEMDIVSVNKDGDEPVIEEIPMEGINPNELKDDQFFFVQPSKEDDVDEPGYDLYMLLMPGTEYFVRATIYFNAVDEECNPELLYTTISFNFTMNILKNGESNWFDIRKTYGN